MPHTNQTSRHDRPGDADRHSYHPADAASWTAPEPRTVQQALDDLAAHGVETGARVYNSANIAIATSTDTPVTFDSTRFDTGDLHDPTVNASRLTAPTAGIYVVAGGLRFSSSTLGNREIRIRFNGTTNLAVLADKPIGNHNMAIATIYKLVAGDYVELVARQSSGFTLNINAIAN
ncbi:MAG: hypothetical protein ACE5EX_10415, partial [Phycisphaerae bacterium]